MGKTFLIVNFCFMFASMHVQAFTKVDEEELLDYLNVLQLDDDDDIDQDYDRSFDIPERSNDGFSITQQDKNLITKYAPLVKLANGEDWKPSSVDFFLKEVNLKGGQNHNPLTRSNLEKCNSDCYLNTKTKISCASCRDPAVFKGQDPTQTSIPVYTIVNKHGNIMDAYLWFFYPYNRGKRVCVGYYANNICPCFKVWGNCVCPRIRGCIGGYGTFGHHVGDWEHVVLRFKDSQIYSLFLSIHDSAVTNQHGGELLWNGKRFQQGNKLVNMVSGTHPIVYAAAGSHGLWPHAGRNVYKKLGNGDTLVDYTSDGKEWKTWENLKLIKYRQSGGYTGGLEWLNFEGRWGNKKRGCFIVESVSGECRLNGGPRGPNRGRIGEGKLFK